MPGDWSLPTNSRAYASVLGDLDSRLIDSITMCSLGDPSNTPTASKKYNESSDKFQRWSGAAWTDLVLSIAGGGTGSATASGARTSLGLGDMATQVSSAVAITGGSLAGVTANANIITAGLVAQARLGTGSTGTGSNFLADDQTYKAVGGSIIGEGKIWFTNTPPTNHLICDGSAISRTTYSSLFAVIGTTWGVGDGSTTFNLPDFRGRVPFGKAASGTGNTLAGVFGSVDHTHTGPAHTHTVPALSLPVSVLDIVNGATSGSLLGLDSAAPSISGQFSGTWWEIAFSGIHTPLNPGPVGASLSGNTGTGTSGSSGTGASGTGNPPCVVINIVVRYA